MMKIGIYLFGFASVASGVLDLVWGEFEPDHQPLHAWGDHIPGITIFAYIAAIWLMAAGTALVWRNSARLGAAGLTILYGIFVLFPLPRFVTAPQYLGYRLSVYVGVTANVCEQVVLFTAAAIAWASLTPESSLSQRMLPMARWVFGFCSIAFGLGHLVALQTVVPLVPKWLPFGATFWAALTGVAFVLAGLGIISGVLDVLAAWLLGWMLLGFSVLSLLPLIYALPHNHVAWGGNAFNLTVMGGAWIVADWLATRKHTIRDRQHARPSI